MAHVTSNVHVVHPRRGGVWLREGDEVPGWASDQIRRAELLDDGTPEAVQEPDTGPDGDGGDTSGDGAGGQQEPDTGDGEAVSEFPPEPPRSGAGSGVEAWREFAAHPAVDLEVDDDASRDDIVAVWDASNAGE